MADTFYGRIQNKHDTEDNWRKAINFVPLKAEIIVYDRDDNYNFPRFKIGDGFHTVNELPFANNTSNIVLTDTGADNLPVYIINGQIKPIKYTIDASVPSDAVFTDTTYEKATQSKTGLMSSADKLKLDNIEENANYIAVDSSLNSNSTNPVQNKIVKQAIDSRAPLSHNHVASEITDIAEVAKTGSYNNLTNKPTIPTKVSQLINDKSYVQQSELPTKLSAFENDSDFIDTTVDNLVNYYTKINTYSKTEVNNLVNTIPTMSIKKVDSLPETGNSKYIYLVSAEATESNNYYNEFLWTGTAYEMIGSTKVNLDGYLTDSGDSSNTSVQFTAAESRILPQSGEILSIIFGKVIKYLNDLSPIAFSGSFNDLQDLNGKGLSTNDYTTEEKNKLNNIEDGANKTVIDTDLSTTSTNPVQNKVINDKFDSVQSDINSRVPSSRTVNGKALTSDIILSASDVGALPSNTEIPSIEGLATETYVDNKIIDNKTIIDSALSSTSTNPIQNKVINDKFNSIQSDIDSKVPSSRTVNGKVLTSDIILSASDVGALPNSTEIPSIEGLATETYVDNKVAGLVDSAPSTLNTLDKLAEAIGDDPNFATTIATHIGEKVDKVEGKNLSTNDFTNDYKTKLDGLSNPVAITIDEIDTICNAAIYSASEVSV